MPAMAPKLMTYYSIKHELSNNHDENDIRVNPETKQGR